MNYTEKGSDSVKLLHYIDLNTITEKECKGVLLPSAVISRTLLFYTI